MTLKDYKGGAAATSLLGVLSTSAPTFTVASATGYPPGDVPFVVAIRRGTATEEKILVTRTGTTFTVVTRGYDDTVAGEHPVGAAVEHVLDAATVKEANAHANAAHLALASVVPAASAPADSAAVGLATTAARADHRHARESVVNLVELVFPKGMIVPFGGVTPPTGWLLCNGAAVSRTTYAGLFGVIGSRYGAGDGSTTFNLPDLRNRLPVGQTLPGDAVSVANIGSHDHTGSSVSSISAGHAHTANTTGGHSGNHNHAVGMNTGLMSAQHAHGYYSGATANRTDGADTDHTHFVSGSTGNETASHSHAVTVNNADHNHTLSLLIAAAANVPAQSVNYIVKG